MCVLQYYHKDNAMIEKRIIIKLGRIIVWRHNFLCV